MWTDGKTNEELLALRANWLSVVNDVQTPTACMIIRKLGELDTELERRGKEKAHGNQDRNERRTKGRSSR